MQNLSYIPELKEFTISQESLLEGLVSTDIDKSRQNISKTKCKMIIPEYMLNSSYVEEDMTGLIKKKKMVVIDITIQYLLLFKLTLIECQELNQ